jgi:hypothetical protein
MTHLLLFLMLAAQPAKPDYVKIMNAQQQIIQDLTAENRKLKNALFGPPGTTVRALQTNEGKAYCPPDGFALMYEVMPGLEPRKFQPFCVRVLK